MSENEKGLQTSLDTAPVSERFTNLVMREFQSSSGNVQLTDHQKSLIQGYFIGIDRALKVAEKARIAANKRNTDPKWNNDLAYTWANVQINEALAQDVVCYAKLGLDVTLPNHISPVPYKDNKVNKYGMSFIKGYRGNEIIAKKYSLSRIVSSTIELVYSNDSFSAVKKGINNSVESYELKILNPFDRGEVVGAFGYLEYENPTENQLFILSKKELLKRRPKKFSVEFWGGEKRVKADGKWETEQVDGWEDEMLFKTMCNYVFKRVPIDSSKIDSGYRRMIASEAVADEAALASEIAENANGDYVDVELAEDPIQIESMAPEECEKPSVSVKKEITEPDF